MSIEEKTKDEEYLEKKTINPIEYLESAQRALSEGHLDIAVKFLRYYKTIIKIKRIEAQVART